MPYRWKTRLDVDESIVVIMNSMDKSPELPNWLVGTISAAIADSSPDMGRYFYAELRKYSPRALSCFEKQSAPD